MEASQKFRAYRLVNQNSPVLGILLPLDNPEINVALHQARLRAASHPAYKPTGAAIPSRCEMPGIGSNVRAWFQRSLSARSEQILTPMSLNLSEPSPT